MVLNMCYGHGRRIRVAKWTVAILAAQSIQDTSIKDRWCRQGPPPEALLIDVVLDKHRVLAATNICLVLEHESFEPVSAGCVIPEQPVVYINVKDVMAVLSTMAPPSAEDDGDADTGV